MRDLVVVFEWGKFIGYPMVALISLIGIRFLSYFRSFFFHWACYRRLDPITTNDLRTLPHVPFVKVQITTRGSPGSTEVIRRGIQNILVLAWEAPDFYSARLSVEIVTESLEQKLLLEQEFDRVPISVQTFLLPDPKEYQTPEGTKLKARALHYMVELRRRGLNRKPGRTFIVHYDEESVMQPEEMRKLISYLATTEKKLTEGPIYYPLEYGDASPICRAMEANRPIGCFECREVMETGTPLHLHGSNLVIDEELENELGWDIGNLDGEPFIAEDYVFGVKAYLLRGPQIFGWHGCVMLEQPPFSFKSAFRQRFRWVVGVLQGIGMMRRMPQFYHLPKKMRFRLVWGTLYRVLTFALGLPTGVTSLLYLVSQAGLVLSGRNFLPMPLPIMCWLIIIGFLWLNSTFIGAWYNLSYARQMSRRRRLVEAAAVLTLVPIAGILESTAAFRAVVQWLLGNRKVSWQPTPKTKQADKTLNAQAAMRAQQPELKRGLAIVALVVSLLGLLTSYLVFFNTDTAPPANKDRLESTLASRLRRPDFQTGIVFPQWGTTAYSNDDLYWRIGLQDIQTQTRARWVELTINLYQPSLTSTQVSTYRGTPIPEAMADGIQLARTMGYHVFVIPLLTVGGLGGSLDGSSGSSHGGDAANWAGAIPYTTEQHAQVWFASYWQALEPYAIAAAQAGAEQMAIGTEYEQLQRAPTYLWDQLIERVHGVFPGMLTYDMNWSSLLLPVPSWMRDPYLAHIGVSAYVPLTNVPQRIAPDILPTLWRAKIRTLIDSFALRLGRPLLLSEIGYRDSSDAFYHPWESHTKAPADPEEQAAAYNAALMNVLVDPKIDGIYFWAWSVPVFQPNWHPAAHVLYRWYTSPLAERVLT
jgi:hypothetical protein